MLYPILCIVIGRAIRIFFKDVKLRNQHNIPRDKPLIIVSNHPSAFMDPLVHGVFVTYPLYFLVRADVFSSKFIVWLFKNVHMAPIYRMVEDGVNSLKKNDKVFEECYKLLIANKTILLFGEGETDDTFVRRIKSLKKGPVRIALGAENKYDFNLGVNIVCAGINYTNPSSFRSNILISLSDPIDVRRYKKLFEEDNTKAMRSLNKEIFKKLKNEVVYLEDKNLDEFFEQLLIISGKGMNNKTVNNNHKLVDRWKYSIDLANKINQLNHKDKKFIDRLKEKTSCYFKSLKEINIDDSILRSTKYKVLNTKYEVRMKKHFVIHHSYLVLHTLIDFLFLIVGFPFFLFGYINNYLPSKIPDYASRMITERPVFYNSIKMMMGILTFPLFYAIILWFVQYIANNWLITAIYAGLMPVTGLFAFYYPRSYRKVLEKFRFKKIVKRDKDKIDQLLNMRKSIVDTLDKISLSPGISSED